MGKVTRRRFISILGLGSILIIRPLSVLSKNLLAQLDSKAKKIFNLLKKKRNSLKTLSFTMIRKVVFLASEKINKIESEVSEFEKADNLKIEFYWKADKSKMVIYFPDKKGSSKYETKVTSVYKDNRLYEKIESLVGDFEPKIESRWATPSEKKKALRLPLETIIPMPEDKPMTFLEEKFLKRERVYIILQGNKKFWISSNKNSVIKIENYKNQRQISSILEFKDFKEILPGMFIPTLIVQKKFDEKGNLISEHWNRIKSIRINEFLPDNLFNI